ncbi:hypothetical protein ACFTAO_44245 [Paenibacillus rhizoplanae]
MKRRIMKIWDKMDIAGPIAGMLIMLYISWNGSYFGSRLLVRHFGWSFSEYGYHLFVMAMQIIIFFSSAGPLLPTLHAERIRTSIGRSLRLCGRSPKAISRLNWRTAANTGSSEGLWKGSTKWRVS